MAISVGSSGGRRKKSGPIGKLFGSVVCGGMGFVFSLVLGYPMFSEHARESVHWPTVQGKVTESRVTSEQKRSKKGGSKTMYSHKLRYHYSVKGQDYDSDLLYFGQTNMRTSWRGFHDEIVKKYPIGKEVKVYYKEDAPGTACLEPGLEVRNAYAFYGGILLILVALLILASAVAGILKFGLLAAVATGGVAAALASRGGKKKRGGEDTEEDEQPKRKKRRKRRRTEAAEAEPKPRPKRKAPPPADDMDDEDDGILI